MDLQSLQRASQLGIKIGHSALFDFISSMPEPAHLKETQNGSYLFSNRSNLEIYKLQDPNEIIGSTVRDLDSFMFPFWGTAFAEHIERLDFQVKNNKETVSDRNRIFLDKSGFIHVQNMIKVPVLNHLNHVDAILTLSFDLTQKTDLFELLSLYKKIYVKKSEAVYYFSLHLKINPFFNAFLTEKELLCLLHMKLNSCYKKTAEGLQVSLKTVETHISHLIGKSKQHSLSDVLTFLRNR